MKSLKELCREPKIRAVVKYGAVEVPAGWLPGTHPYKVTLYRKGRQTTAPFFMGPALLKEPTAYDVLRCLILDTQGYVNAGSFESWARDCGVDYPDDDGASKKTYRAVERGVKKLEKFLGEDFEVFLGARDDD